MRELVHILSMIHRISTSTENVTHLWSYDLNYFVVLLYLHFDITEKRVPTYWYDLEYQSLNKCICVLAV